MAIQSQHVTGFVVGLGAAAVGFYFYKKNQHQVDAFLREHGIELPECGSLVVENLTLEQLVAEKERLEDIIAEREYVASQETPEPVAEKAPKRQVKTKRTKAKAKRAAG